MLYTAAMQMLATLGARQQELLKALLENPGGLTVDQIRRQLGISRNAVIQHLQSLEKLTFVEAAMGHSSVGRPGKVYSLSATGREMFPRHYSLFSTLLVRRIREKYGEEDLVENLRELGRDLAGEYHARVNARLTLNEKVEEASKVMRELGYEARSATGRGEHATDPRIIASNCVFHKLAEECPAVCQLDLALLENLIGAPVEHEECMVRGGKCCKFRFRRQDP